MAWALAATDSSDWVNSTDGIANLMTIVVAVVAGGFAYFKFVRGRVFQPRCDINIEAMLVRTARTNSALVKVTIRNAGQAHWTVDSSKKNLIYVFSLDELMLDEAATNLDDVVWEGGEYRAARIVSERDIPLESGESVTTSVLLPLSDSAVGVRAFVWLWGSGGRWAPRDWSADTVVVAGVD